MSFNYVKIYYGPCNSFYTNVHKPQKLRGMRDRLLKIGYRVDLVPVKYIDYCMLEMCGHEVFRCNLRNLKFNTSYNRDPVCKRAIEAVIESTSKFARARNYLWSWQMLEDQMFKRGEYAPKEYWPFDFDIKPFALSKDCADCCGILLTQNPDDEV